VWCINGIVGGESGRVKVVVDQEVGRGLVFVNLAGELDLLTSDEVRSALSELVDRGHHQLAVDLRDLAFIDSTGLAVLVGALKKVREHHGSLVLISADGHPRRVLKITGLDKVFGVYPSREEIAGPGS